jgi:hypothetical protein
VKADSVVLRTGDIEYQFEDRREGAVGGCTKEVRQTGGYVGD